MLKSVSGLISMPSSSMSMIKSSRPIGGTTIGLEVSLIGGLMPGDAGDAGDMFLVVVVSKVAKKSNKLLRIVVCCCWLSTLKFGGFF